MSFEGRPERPGLSVEFVRPLTRGLERLGVPIERFHALLGLGPGAEPIGHVSLFRVGSALEMIASKKGLPHLAVEVARHMPLGVLGAADYTWSASSTLMHSILRTGSHIEHLTDGLRMELQIEDGGKNAHMIMHSRVDVHPPIMTELTFAIIISRMRHVLGGAMALNAVRFRHLARGPKAPYDAFFQTTVDFGASIDEAVFPASVLQEPLVTADPELLALLRKHPRVTTVRTASSSDVFLQAARAALESALADGETEIDVTTLAKRLRTSTRSLQRRLGERKTSFSDLHDDVRRDLATTLLENDNLLLTDVAQRLGFKDVSAFHRAFRRWTGASPRAFQERQQR
jgi:AraC-like DNA-binding protein